MVTYVICDPKYDLFMLGNYCKFSNFSIPGQSSSWFGATELKGTLMQI